MNTRRTHWEYWVIGLLAPLALVGACLATVVLGEVWLAKAPRAAVPAAQMVRLCVSVRVTSGMRLATWWSAAISTRTGLIRRPFMQSNMVCGLAPWQPWLPASGSLQSSN